MDVSEANRLEIASYVSDDKLFAVVLPFSKSRISSDAVRNCEFVSQNSATSVASGSFVRGAAGGRTSTPPPREAIVYFGRALPNLSPLYIYGLP